MLLARHNAATPRRWRLLAASFAPRGLGTGRMRVLQGEKPFPRALKAWTTLRVAHPTATPLSPAKTVSQEGDAGAEGGSEREAAPRVRPQLHLELPACDHAVASVGRYPGLRAGPGSPQEPRSWVLATHPPPRRGRSL